MQSEVKKHSALGIFSFIIGLSDFLGLCLILILNINYKSERVDYLVNSFSILAGLISIVGVVLGIIGCIQKNPKKVFAIFGLILSVLVLLFISWGWISVALGM
jgi:hypothetical protein